MAQIRSDMWLDLYNRERNILALKQHMAEPVGIEIFARDPLHDRGFEVLPDLEKWRGWLPDLLLNSLIVWTVFWALLIPSQRRIKWQGIVTLRRFLWCLSVLYIFRMCSFMVTTLPSPAKNCMPKYVPVNDVEDMQEYLSLMGKMVSGTVTACTDNIYSGHTSLIALLLMTCLVYSGRWWVKVIAFVSAAITLASIVATRLHYTVDILIALFVASFVFAIYHFLLMIYMDARMLRLDNRIHRTTPLTANEDMALMGERSLAARMVWTVVGRIIWWVDGLDIRVGPYETSQLIGEEEQPKMDSAVHSPELVDIVAQVEADSYSEGNRWKNPPPALVPQSYSRVLLTM